MRNPDLEKMIRKQRKSKREVLELKELLAKVNSHKNPDPKIVKMINDEINALLEVGVV